MDDQEIKAKIMHRFFEQYANKDEAYLHSEFIHHDVNSPKEVIPLLKELRPIHSVVDVGCGLAAWLKVFKDMGAADIMGIDGMYTKQRKLMISEEDMLFYDLETLNEKMPVVDRKFDLALCLEVAEHLKPEIAPYLVKFLTQLSDVILFSAAVPYQGGINHVNEQWVEYWQALFEEEEFIYYDVIRPKIWSNKNVKWWYKQNAFIVAKKGVFDLPKEPISNMIHPELFLQHMVSHNTQ